MADVFRRASSGVWRGVKSVGGLVVPNSGSFSSRKSLEKKGSVDGASSPAPEGEEAEEMRHEHDDSLVEAEAEAVTPRAARADASDAEELEADGADEVTPKSKETSPPAKRRSSEGLPLSSQNSVLTDSSPPSPYLPSAMARGSRRGHLRVGSDVSCVSFGLPESEESDEPLTWPEREGKLLKWTNYFNGWQPRWIVLADGMLSYYKDEDDKATNCRGTIDISSARIAIHDVDSNRFDVDVKGTSFHLRCASMAERDKWVALLEETKSLRDGGPSRLSRKGSTMSLSSIGSAGSHTATLQEKMSELTTYEATLKKQVAAFSNSVSEILDAGPQTDLLQEEGVAVRATASALLAVLEDCMDSIQMREDMWQRKFNRVTERKRQLEQLVSDQQAERTTTAQLLGPDMEEGPFAALTEEQFFDAVETGLDAAELEDEERRLGEQREAEAEAALVKQGSDIITHRFTDFMEPKIKDSLSRCSESVEGGRWAVIHSEGTMKVYRRAATAGETDDRLRATHSIAGITAKELCNYFWNTKVRLDWEHTIDRFNVLEWLDQTTNINHSIHKRVWPTAQRDSILLSHIRQVDEVQWMVWNHSVDHDADPKKYVRLTADVALVVKTIIAEGATKPYQREDITSEITYFASINPGGWAPPSVVCEVSKREYPKFLRNLSKYSSKHNKDKPVDM